MNQYPFPLKYRTLIEVINNLRNFGLKPFVSDPTLLQKLWYDYKTGFRQILEKINMKEYLDIDDINFSFHLNENYQFSYDPTSNCLELNVLSFFFHINPDDDRVFFEMDYKLVATLIHEIDHYLYAKEHSIIGLSEEDKEEFDKIHETKLEIRAYSNQKKVVQRYGSIADKNIIVYEIRRNGEIAIVSEKTSNIIAQSVSFLDTILEQVENPEEYSNIGLDQSKRLVNRLGQVFSVPIEKTKLPESVVRIKF